MKPFTLLVAMLAFLCALPLAVMVTRMLTHTQWVTGAVLGSLVASFVVWSGRSR